MESNMVQALTSSFTNERLHARTIHLSDFSTRLYSPSATVEGHLSSINPKRIICPTPPTTSGVPLLRTLPARAFRATTVQSSAEVSYSRMSLSTPANNTCSSCQTRPHAYERAAGNPGRTPNPNGESPSQAYSLNVRAQRQLSQNTAIKAFFPTHSTKISSLPHVSLHPLTLSGYHMYTSEATELWSMTRWSGLVFFVSWTIMCIYGHPLAVYLRALLSLGARAHELASSLPLSMHFFTAKLYPRILG